MKAQCQKGTAAVEFAICLPLLAVLVFGIIECSILLFDKAMITNSSREGARAGIVYSHPDRPSSADITAVVENYCKDNLISFGAGSTVNTTFPNFGTNTGEPLTVRVTYNYKFLTLPNLIISLSDGINVTAETTMRLE